MMAKTTTASKSKKSTDKPARSKTRAVVTKPSAVRKSTKAVASKAVDAPAEIERTELSKKELIERLVATTDMKKGEARRALDAVLGVFGEALAEGSNIAAAPLGKVKIARTKDTATGQLVVCRVKLKKPVDMATAAE